MKSSDHVHNVAAIADDANHSTSALTLVSLAHGINHAQGALKPLVFPLVLRDLNFGYGELGIMLGVATLIIVMAVMNGFRTELISRILGINGHMIVQPIDGPLNNYAELATKFSGVKGVTMAIPLVEGQVLAQGVGDSSTGALVRGIRADDLSKMKSVSDHIQSGDMVGFASGSGVAIGSRMAEQLGILPHVIEAVLNHVSGHKAGVAGIYNRADYTVQKRQALTLWAEHLSAIVEERPATVVALSA